MPTNNTNQQEATYQRKSNVDFSIVYYAFKTLKGSEQSVFLYLYFKTLGGVLTEYTHSANIIATDVNISRRSAQTALEGLRAKGWITSKNGFVTGYKLPVGGHTINVNFIREQLSQSGENISQGGEEISNIGEKISQTGEKFSHTYYLDNINNNKTKYVENLSADAAKTDVGGTEPERGKDPLYISGLSFSAPVGVAPVGVSAYKVEEVPSSDTSQRARAEEPTQTGAIATETGTASTEWDTYTNGTETTEQPPEMPPMDEPAPWDELNRNWEDNTQPKEAEPTIEELQEKRETYHRAIKRLFAAMRMTSNKEQWERLNNRLQRMDYFEAPSLFPGVDLSETRRQHNGAAQSIKRDMQPVWRDKEQLERESFQFIERAKAAGLLAYSPVPIVAHGATNTTADRVAATA